MVYITVGVDYIGFSPEPAFFHLNVVFELAHAFQVNALNSLARYLMVSWLQPFTTWSKVFLLVLPEIVESPIN